MSKKRKRRRRKPAARPSKAKLLAENIFAGVVSGLIAEAITRVIAKMCKI